MHILMLGAGVIGTTYAWQLAEAGHAVTLFVRPERKDTIAREGIPIHCRDERTKPPAIVDIIYRPNVVDRLDPAAGYELIIVSVRAHQLDTVLPLLATGAGRADVLFFHNTWWGDASVKQVLPEGQYLFGFSRLVGGWRTAAGIEAIIFDSPQLPTMLGEKDGQITPRLQRLVDLFDHARLRPQISRDILGWLATHYVEFLGAVGGIRQAGSASAFAANRALVKAAILATREGLAVCRARGIDVDRAAPMNLRLYALPTMLLVPLAQWQYRMPNIQQFLEENIAHGMEELNRQYTDVVTERRRLGIKMLYLEGFGPTFTPDDTPLATRTSVLQTVS